MSDFNDIISSEEYFIGLPDCIADGNDYKNDIENSFLLTKGILKLNGFSSAENDGRFEFDLIVNDKPENFSVEIMSDYIDSDGLINGLNELLVKCGYNGSKKFCDINGGIADFGVSFITKDQEIKLALEGMIWREEQ